MFLIAVSMLAGFTISFFILVPTFEWLLHRHTMHTEKRCWVFNGLYRLHDKTHHKAYDHHEHYTKRELAMRRAPSLMEGLSFNGWFMFGIIALHGVGYLLLLIPFMRSVPWTLLAAIFIGLITGSGVFGFLQIKFHYWYHAADGFGYRILTQLPMVKLYFLYMCEHHREHHKDTLKNLNTLVPTVDLVIYWWNKLLRPNASVPQQ